MKETRYVITDKPPKDNEAYTEMELKGRRLYMAEIEQNEEQKGIDVSNISLEGLSQTELEKYLEQLKERFPGREEALHAALLALLSGHSVFFLGPPGTAKSLILETIAESMGLKVFSKLLSEYTLPEELFGPVDVPSLKKGKWRRITTGKLPETNIAFLDEIFKSTTILNTLLRVINEKKFENGDEMMDVPLYALFAASNEIPSDPSLLALYDRLVIRTVLDTIEDPLIVNEIKKRSHDATLNNWKPPKFPVDIDKAREEVKKVKIPDSIITLTTNIEMQILTDIGVMISNRKQVQALDVIKAEAYIHGRDTVSIFDLNVLSLLYWNEIDEIEPVSRIITEKTSPALNHLKKIKTTIYADINDKLINVSSGTTKSSRIIAETMIWTSAKTLIERTPEPVTEEERESVLAEIAGIITTLNKYTADVATKPPINLKWS